MIKKIAVPALIASLILNVVLFTHGCQPSTMDKKCQDNPISECNDGKRFHQRHFEGKCWEVSDQMQRDYHDRYTQSAPSHMPGIFISKKILNEVFRADKSANGIVCTFGLDKTNHFGILIQPDQSDSTDISSTPTAFEKNSSSKYLLAQVPSSDSAKAITAKMYFTKIYCPPQCVHCDTCQTN